MAPLGAQWGEVKMGIGEIDGGLESVAFSVCSLWSSPPTVCRDCGLTAQAHRHTISHTLSSGFEQDTDARYRRRTSGLKSNNRDGSDGKRQSVG